MSNWKMISKFVKFTTKGITPSYVDHSSIIVLNQKCIRNNKIDYSLSRFTNDSKNISPNKFVKKWDILVNSTGAWTAGRCAFVSEIPDKYRLIVDSHILILRCRSYYEAQCLSYILYSFESKLMSYMTWSSGQSELDKVVLLWLKTKMTENPDVQEKIAFILSTIDKKIKLNNTINLELNCMIKTVYNYWFLQYDFPNENGKPYKSSWGEMVWCDKLKRNIPKWWKTVVLDDIVSRTATWLNPRKNFVLWEWENYYITIKSINDWKITFDSKCDRVSDEALKIIDKRSDLQPGDVLFTSIQPVWVTYLIHEKPVNRNINESVFTIRADYDKVTSEYLYMLLSSDEMKSFTDNASAWSIHKWIRHGVLKTFKLAYSWDKELYKKFSLVAEPILKRINMIDKENQKLTELRDWLLPMLMNGQVTVK